jgi:hypothetical protein
LNLKNDKLFSERPPICHLKPAEVAPLLKRFADINCIVFDEKLRKEIINVDYTTHINNRKNWVLAGQ